MKIYTIEEKMSGTGNIHDLASEQCDREIRFRAGTKYAVVLAAFFGDHYTTHKTARTAARMSNKTYYSHKIIDADGNRYVANGDTLMEV